MKRIIFHIGHDKTATTSAQQTLGCNASLLLEHGYLYPLPDNLKHHNRLFVLLFKKDLPERERLRFSLGIDDRFLAKSDYYRNWLVSELSSTAADTVVFSGEYFPRFSEMEWRDICLFFRNIWADVHFEIYSYAREPIAYAASANQQRARLFPTDDKVVYFPYKKKLEKFITVFGREDIHVLSFEDGCKDDGGPVAFLCKAMHMPDCMLTKMRWYRTNEGLSLPAMELLTYINTRVPFTKDALSKGLRKRGDLTALFSLPGKKYKVDQDTRRQLMAATQPHLCWLRGTFALDFAPSKQNPSDDQAIEFSEAYTSELISGLRSSSPVIRRLVFEYIDDSVRNSALSEATSAQAHAILQKMKRQYPMTIRLPYRCLAAPGLVKNILKKSALLRKIKRKVFEQ
ncbi:MAG: hypothetical protein GY922_00120 [Proteobacteria bacterium]|nr:hypothetical protein [Pseudomonadota bacterium]